MGTFSFKTQDTNESVWNFFSNNDDTSTVYLVAPDGQKWKEDNYGGYGEFGGKDIYELISEINGGPSCRINGIGLAFDGCKNGQNNKIIWPNLVRKDSNYNAKLGFIESCPHQGNRYWANDDFDF